MKNPSPELQLQAVSRNPQVISHHYIDNPTPEAQLAAIKQNFRLIDLIKNPAPEVKALADELARDRAKELKSK